MLHDICPYQAARASQARFAVNCNGSLCRLTNGEELLHDGIAGRAAIDEEQILVIETSVLKGRCVIDFGIQPNHCCHIIIPKIAKVALRCMARISIRQRLALLMGPAKRYKLLGHNPVKVAVLHALEILIFLSIKVVEIKESRLQAFVHSIQAVQQRNLKVARSVAGVTKARVGRNLASDQRPICLLWCLVKVDYLETINQIYLF